MAPRRILIAGPTQTGKTELATRTAAAAGALLLPIDQLQMYAHLQHGVGLDIARLQRIRTFGYQILDPWFRFAPQQYADWLRDALLRFRSEPLIVIEGGCTSYLAAVVERLTADPLLNELEIFALDPDESSESRSARISDAYTNSLVEQIVRELELLGRLGYWRTSGADLFEQCESTFVHPEHEDSRLAWALRISAGVYYPAYLALEGKLSLEEACVRIAANVFRIQSYQRRRICSILPASRICRYEALRARLSGYLADRGVGSS
jgi:hypothetical protein